IADSCEAAARSLAEPTPENVRFIVIKIIDAILADDQLGECDLTLRELTQIREAMIRSLVAIYHSRVDYPGYVPPTSGQFKLSTDGNLITALSSCFSFTCLLGALTLGYLIWKHTDLEILRGITLINLIIFGTLLVVVLCLTFIIPVTFVTLIFVNLLIAYLLM